MDRLVRLLRLDFAFTRSQAWLLLFSLCGLPHAAFAEQFPYMAYVAEDQAYIRSGPGQRYYPTSRLPQGFAVEVYRHDDDGWCAIRPPAESFSWVGSHQVRQIEAGVVEIVEDNVVARVGSSISKQRSAVQILLPKGEQVRLLSDSEEDDPRWVRVAPPAGEFRWVAANALSRQPPIETTPLPSAEHQGWSRQSVPSDLPVANQTNEFDHIGSGNEIVKTDLQFGSPSAAKAAIPVPSKLLPTDPKPMAPNAMDPNAVDIVAGSPADMRLAQYQVQPAPPRLLSEQTPTSSSNPSIPPSSSPRPRVRFQGHPTSGPTAITSVEELEVRLSQAVSQAPSEWNLSSLETAANQLLATTTTLSVRAHLREVIARIDRFQEVKQRYENPPPMIIPERDPFELAQGATAAEGETPRELTGLSSDVRDRIKEDLDGKTMSPRVASSPASPAKVTKPLFDAAGMLKPVVSQRPKAPKFALVDDQGKVVSFVTPTPELDLKQYVGRRIGVHGSRGYMPEYRRAHVTAGRVTPLSETIRR